MVETLLGAPNLLDLVHWRLQPGVWTSLYAVQLEAWTLEFRRAQFLVAQYDDLFDVATGRANLEPLRAFLGLAGGGLLGEPPPPLDDVVVPKENLQDRADKQRVVACATRDRLHRVIYDAWNARLYARLAADHADGRAPPQEPAFPPFRRDAAPCVD